MFITSAGPTDAVFHNGLSLWGPSPNPVFAFDLTNPDLFLKQHLQNLNVLAAKQTAFRTGLRKMATGRGGSHHGNSNGHKTEQYQLRANDFDQSMVWFQNMDDPNEAFRGQPGNGRDPALNQFTSAPGQASHSVSPPSSSSNKHGNVPARRQTKSIPSNGGVKTEAHAADVENLWNAASISANVNHNLSQPINVQGTQGWPSAPDLSNGCIQTYGFTDGLAHGLPIFPNSHAAGPSFGLAPTMSGMPNVDSSSSSSCRVNGSSPDTVFGSFSSSIGPPEMMDMDVTEECFHSPSVFPSEVPSCHNHGTIPQAFLTGSAAHNFGITPGVVFADADTVSPKMLNLKNVPNLPSSSSSESLPNAFHMDSDPEVASAPAVPQEAVLPSSTLQAARESGSKPNKAGRKQLPDKAPNSKATAPSNGSKRRHGGEVTGDKNSTPSSKKSKAKTKASSQAQQSQAQQSQAQPTSHHHRPRHGGGSDARTKTTHRKESSSKAATNPASDNAPKDESATPPRSEKDEFLVQSKLAGMTYKEIRKKGGFTEAESTLRGRFRTLTKPKEARVRKPEFQEIDDKLLRRAVVKLTKDVKEITRDNVPWKLVAEYMVDHGGSYLFGYTTIRKRWEYLMVTSEEQVKQDRADHKFQL